MIIDKITISGYKPLLPSGNTKITIDILSNILPIIGQNGSGKSTMLKEITPMPSTSSDYTDTGYKELELTHEGSSYVISSRFGQKGAHSFIKDGTELNTSGTTGVQTSLCNSELGITPIIHSIITGAVTICSMVRGERKKVLLSCYPSNLLFILEHHKKTCSKLKAVNTNLKMLNSRRATLEDSALTADGLTDIQISMSELIATEDHLNKVILTLTEEIRHLKQHVNYNTHILRFDMDGMQSDISKLYSKATNLHTAYPDYLVADPVVSIPRLEATEDHLLSNLENINEEIHDLVGEIDKFENMNSSLSADKITEYETTILSIKKDIQSITIDPNIPVVTKATLDMIDVHILQQHLVSLSNTTHVMSSVEYTKASGELIQAINEHSSRSREMEQLVKDRDAYAHRIDRIEKYGFKPNCILVCPARERSDESLSELKSEYTVFTDKIVEYSAILNRLSNTISKLEEPVSVAKANLVYVQYIELVLDLLGLNDFIIHMVGERDSSTLIDVLKINPMSISNLISKIIISSTDTEKLNILKEQLNDNESRLVSLLETKQSTIDMLSGSIDKKRCKLSELSTNHNTILSKITEVKASMTIYNSLLAVSGGINTVKHRFNTDGMAYFINKKIEVLELSIRDAIKYKELVVEEQIGIKLILKEQESIKVRLSEEIIPNLDILNKQHEKLVKLERALSPTTGLPYIHMVRFINNIIAKTNILIGQVWEYDMELVMLSEHEPLEFNIPVKLYDNIQLKDISMLSKGQGEMVDLAFTIALFINMDLGDTYPMKLDEIDAGMVDSHRSKLLTLFSTLLQSGDIQQLFLVNHHSTLYSAFNQAQIVCLDPGGVTLPTIYNNGVVLKK